MGASPASYWQIRRRTRGDLDSGVVTIVSPSDGVLEEAASNNYTVTASFVQVHTNMATGKTTCARARHSQHYVPAH